MKTKFTTIRLKPYISTIDFEQLDKTNEPITSFKTSETNSLTKTSNLIRFPRKKTSLAKLSNYQFFSVKKVPDEEELDLLIKKFSIVKKNPLANVTRKKNHPNFEKKGRASRKRAG